MPSMDITPRRLLFPASAAVGLMSLAWGNVARGEFSLLPQHGGGSWPAGKLRRRTAGGMAADQRSARKRRNQARHRRACKG